MKVILFICFSLFSAVSFSRELRALDLFCDAARSSFKIPARSTIVDYKWDAGNAEDTEGVLDLTLSTLQFKKTRGNPIHQIVQSFETTQSPKTDQLLEMCQPLKTFQRPEQLKEKKAFCLPKHAHGFYLSVPDIDNKSVDLRVVVEGGMITDIQRTTVREDLIKKDTTKIASRYPEYLQGSRWTFVRRANVEEHISLVDKEIKSRSIIDVLEKWTDVLFPTATVYVYEGKEFCFEPGFGAGYPVEEIATVSLIVRRHIRSPETITTEFIPQKIHSVEYVSYMMSQHEMEDIRQDGFLKGKFIDIRKFEEGSLLDRFRIKNRGLETIVEEEEPEEAKPVFSSPASVCSLSVSAEPSAFLPVCNPLHRKAHLALSSKLFP